MISREKAEKYSTEPSLFLRIVFKLFMQRMIKRTAKKGYSGIDVSVSRLRMEGLIGKILVKIYSGSMLVRCTLMQVNTLKAKGYKVTDILDLDSLGKGNKADRNTIIMRVTWKEDN